jgi:hypothetical protein
MAHMELDNIFNLERLCFLSVVKSQSQDEATTLAFTEELQDFPDKIDEFIQSMIAQGKVRLVGGNPFSLLKMFVQRPDVRPFDCLMVLDFQVVSF